MCDYTEIDQKRIDAFYYLPYEISKKDQEMMEYEDIFCKENPNPYELDDQPCIPAPLYEQDIEFIEEYLQELEEQRRNSESTS